MVAVVPVSLPVLYQRPHSGDLCASASREATMRRFHIALAVADLKASIADYTQRLGVAPTAVVPGKYALFRIESQLFSPTDQDAKIPEVYGDTVVWAKQAAE